MQRTHPQDSPGRDDADEQEQPEPTPNFLSAREFQARGPSRPASGSPAEAAKSRGRRVKGLGDTDDADD